MNEKENTTTFQSTRKDVIAKQHWDYVEKLLEVHNIDQREIGRIGYHYVMAFLHGWKHAEQWLNEG